MDIKTAQNKIKEIKLRLMKGENYAQCKLEAKEPLAIINNRGAEIARQHGMRYKPITFSSIIR